MKIPPFVRAGDLILVVAPSFSGEIPEIEQAVQALKKLGFRVELGAFAAEKAWGRFPASDSNRAKDLQWALDHPEARVVLCLRGGYGMTRIVDRLSFEGILRHPKWVIGFSDITLLHSRLQGAGLASIHGPMLVHFARPAQATACREEIEFISGRQPFLKYILQAIRPASNPIQGILRGGNLSLLAHQSGHGNNSLPENTVLFLEEVGEAYYRIDRMLWQLANAGLFKQVSGVVLGQFTDCNPDNFPLSIPEMVLEKTTAPVYAGLPAGHGVPGFPVVCGGKISLVEEAGTWVFSQTVRTISSIP